MKKRVLGPPTDEQLAAAEKTDQVRRDNVIAMRQDEDEQEPLALAGEPESAQAKLNREAVMASATVNSSTPAPPPDEVIDVSPAPKTRKVRQPKKIAQRPASQPAAPTSPADEGEDREDALATKAYELMELAYKKSARTAETGNIAKANKELALALWKDAVIFIRAGIIRMTDLHTTIEKLTGTKSAGKDNPAEEENEDDMAENLREDLRKMLRGGR